MSTKKDKTSEKMSPFDFVKSIQTTKIDLFKDSLEAEKVYNAYLVNKALSFHIDSIFHANVMNVNSGLDVQLQYDYYINSIRKMKRKHAWFKKTKNETLELICRYFQVNHKKAQEIEKILTDKQVEVLARIDTDNNNNKRKK